MAVFLLRSSCLWLSPSTCDGCALEYSPPTLEERAAPNVYKRRNIHFHTFPVRIRSFPFRCGITLLPSLRTPFLSFVGLVVDVRLTALNGDRQFGTRICHLNINGHFQTVNQLFKLLWVLRYFPFCFSVMWREWY